MHIWQNWISVYKFPGRQGCGIIEEEGDFGVIRSGPTSVTVQGDTMHQQQKKRWQIRFQNTLPKVKVKVKLTRNGCTQFMLVVMGALLSACADQTPPANSTQSSVPEVQPPYQVVTNIHETMAWILDPAADVIWDSAGTIITAQGSEELAPTTAEGWAEVVNAAAVLSEAGNLLMMPGRAAGDDWIEYSRGLVDAGQLALKAAQAQDSDALFDAGGRIFQVCKACHTQYWVKSDETGELE
jgi:hypothetical protein